MNYLLLVTPITLVLAQNWRSPNWKTFSSSEQECSVYCQLSKETLQRYSKYGYPNELSCRKLINCILIDLHAWDDVTGIKDHVITNFFQPPKADSDYRDRTQECLRTTVPKQCEGEPFERPYRSFQCYYHNYGPVVQTEQFIPYYQTDRIAHLRESLSIVNTSCNALKDFSLGHGFNQKELAVSLFTFSIRTGFYDVQHGPYVDRLYTQFGTPDLLYDSTRQCISSVQKKYCEEPERIFQLFHQCVEKYISTDALYEQTAKLILASKGSCCM